MNKFLKLFVCLLFIFFIAQTSWAEEYKVLVLPDNIQFDSTNYYIYPDASVIFATDTINQIKKNGKIQTIGMSDVRDALRKNTKLNILTKKALKEFKYNYNIAFVDFKAIAHNFDTDKVLVITSQTDFQNYVLRCSPWHVLNIPGMSSIDPAYKVSTYVALIDVDKEQIIWQNTYYKNISSFDHRIIAQNFAPATEQLEKIKFYSDFLLSPHIANIVETKLLPPVDPNKPNAGIVDVSNTQTDILPPDEPDVKSKVLVPIRQKPKTFGEMINDL